MMDDLLRNRIRTFELRSEAALRFFCRENNIAYMHAVLLIQEHHFLLQENWEKLAEKRGQLNQIYDQKSLTLS